VTAAPPEQGPITPSGETEPVGHDGDAADDPAIWIHPTDPASSTIIGTDKQGAIEVYDLAGDRLFRYVDASMNNVDLRYDFPIDGRRIDLVVATDRSNDLLRFYEVVPTTGGLTALGTAPAGPDVYGLCLYRSPATGDFYAFSSDMSGTIQQWELADGGDGTVEASRVRTLVLSSVTEGCVADDAAGSLYVAEESTAIWRYEAEPGGGDDKTVVDRVGDGLSADIEGLGIYSTDDGGYLVASSQGDDAFVIYELPDPDGALTTFRVEAGRVDEVTHTDGLDVTSTALGDRFPGGLLVVQDDDNDGNQNFKLVPWERVAGGTPVRLQVDTAWDPRRTEG